ncbi:hypothetical protein D3C85_1198130 [compost metagenome]
MAHSDEVRHFETDVPLYPQTRHVCVHFAVAGGGGDDPHMTVSAEALQRERLAGDGVVLATHAYVTMMEQTASEEACLQVWQQAYGEVDGAALQRLDQGYGGVAHGTDAAAWCQAGEGIHQARGEVDFTDIGHRDGEGAFAG